MSAQVYHGLFLSDKPRYPESFEKEQSLMALSKPISRGVILAAGDGDRMGSLTVTSPKVLLPVNDRALISYPIEAMAAAGIGEIAIVVGYLGDRVAEVLGDGSSFKVKIQYISNPDYLGGNAVSVHKVRDWAKGAPVVLCMGDHLIEDTLVRRLLDRQSINETLCVDYTPAQHHQIAESTKVVVDSAGCITDIGKDIICWDAIDTGVFLLTENFFRALDELVSRLGIDVEISDVIRLLIERGHRFHTCDVSGCSWADVDTEEDLNMVRV